MNVVLTIGGRKAIPVRALPFVAGRRGDATSRLSPDEVARVAGHQDGFHRAELFATYEVVDDAVRLVPPSQWGQFIIDFQALSARLDKEQPIYVLGYAQWKDDSIRLLPAGVFVWLDEFQTWYSRTRPLVAEDSPLQDDDGDIKCYQESDDLCFFPVVPRQLCDCIREGFERQFDAPACFERLTDALEGWFDKPLAELPAWQHHRVKTDSWSRPWDALSPDQRRSAAAQWDFKHDPAYEQERGRAWDLWCELDDVRREIAEWDALRPQSIPEKARQTDELNALREREKRLNEVLAGTGKPGAGVQSDADATKPKRETQADRIERCVSDCEQSAAELDLPFDRARMPGTKAEFLDLLHALDAELRSIKTVDSLDRYLTLNGCKWPLDASAQPSALQLYARLFPKAHIRTPGAASPQRRKA